jgi:hypothetical protein
MIESLARHWRLALLGVLMVLAAALPADADPTLIWSTYLGGSRNDNGTAIAVWQGTTFVAGSTFSADYPVYSVSSSKPGSDETTSDAFVTALDSSGAPIYSTYVPLGEGNETVADLDVGPDGSAYVVGTVTYEGNGNAIVVAKLDPWGNLNWMREVRGYVYAFRLSVDGQGNVYVIGFDGDDYEAGLFLWRLGPDGSTHYRLGFDRYSYYLSDIAGDAFGNVYLSGSTENTDLPNPTGPAPDSLNGFVMKISPAGSILWSAYLGGRMVDAAGDLVMAPDGSVVVTGSAVSQDFPTLNALQPAPSGFTTDGFLVRLSPSGAPIFSTYLHASSVSDLEVTASGIHMVVSDEENDSPFRQLLDSSCGRIFLLTLDANASQIQDASCLDRFDIPNDLYVPDIAADLTGISVTGPAPSNLPVENAWQPAPAGEGDAFAAKLDLNSAPDCSAAVASHASLWPANGRFVSVPLRGVKDPKGRAVTIALTSIFQDEWLTVPGTPDASGVGTSRARLRVSRLNGGDGRVYHLRFTATDAHGNTCTGTVKVCVPTTRGGTCGDGGARVDSTLHGMTQ